MESEGKRVKRQRLNVGEFQGRKETALAYYERNSSSLHRSLGYECTISNFEVIRDLNFRETRTRSSLDTLQGTIQTSSTHPWGVTEIELKRRREGFVKLFSLFSLKASLSRQRSNERSSRSGTKLSVSSNKGSSELSAPLQATARSPSTFFTPSPNSAPDSPGQ